MFSIPRVWCILTHVRLAPLYQLLKFNPLPLPKTSRLNRTDLMMMMMLAEDDTYVSGTCLARIESAQDLFEVILRVRRQGVAARVHTYRGAPGDAVIELDVRRLRLVELHVPVAVRWDLLRQPLAERDLREGGTVRWEASRRERSCTCSSCCSLWLGGCVGWFFECDHSPHTMIKSGKMKVVTKKYIKKGRQVANQKR